MISKLAKYISYYLSQNGRIPENQQIYAYGLECFINELISDILLLLCGIITHKSVQLFIWCISFTLIRINLGGFHALTHARCIFLGTFLAIVNLYISPIWMVSYPWSAALLICFSLFIAVHYAPIVHKNHPVSKIKTKKAKRNAIIFILLEGIIGFLLFPYLTEYIAYIFSAMLTALIMALVTILKISS